MSDGRWLRRAAGEFGVIVMGVLVALAIQSWWQARQDRQREAVYLQGVGQELQAYLDALDQVLGGNTIAHEALERARLIRDRGQLPDSARAFVSHLVSATTYIILPTVSTALYDDLISTGNVRLIQDDELRAAILDTYSLIEANLERYSLAEAAIDPRLTALISRYLPPNAISRGNDVFDVLVSDAPEDQPTLEVAAERISSDERFEAELNAEYRRLERSRQQAARHLAAAQEAVDDIRAKTAMALRGST